jgi:hypothetical protein
LFAAHWGPRTADILRATLLTLATARARDGQRFTLMELPDLLTNPGFRRTVVSQVHSRQVASFWAWYEALSEAAKLNVTSPVLNKIRAFALSTPMRQMLGQSAGIDFNDVLAGNKIVIVPLKKGRLGSDGASLMGSLVIGCVWQATFARASIPASKRKLAWLYVDEFQDVVRLPIDLAELLEQARGLSLGLTLAHQQLGQLTPQMKAAVRSTARTHVMFQLLDVDAKDLASAFEPLSADDLRHLGLFEIAMRPCIGGLTAAPVTGTTLPMSEPTIDGQALARASVARYGMAPDDIETELAARVHITPGKRSNRFPLPGTSS